MKGAAKLDANVVSRPSRAGGRGRYASSPSAPSGPPTRVLSSTSLCVQGKLYSRCFTLRSTSANSNRREPDTPCSLCSITSNQTQPSRHPTACSLLAKDRTESYIWCGNLQILTSRPSNNPRTNIRLTQERRVATLHRKHIPFFP